MTETLKEKTKNILLSITSDLKYFLEHHNFKYKEADELNYARITLNWATTEEPDTVLKLYKQIYKLFQIYQIEDEIDIIISQGNLEFRNHKNDYRTKCEVYFTQEYIEFYSQFEGYINELIYELHSHRTYEEPLGYSISMLKSKYDWMFRMKSLTYKNTDLSNAFVYYSKDSKCNFLKNKDIIVSTFKRYGDFEFFWNKKRSEMDNYWCLFIKPKKN